MLSSDNSNGSPNLNNKNYTALFDKNPFSLAMTAGNRIEYTLESEDQTVLLEKSD